MRRILPPVCLVAGVVLAGGAAEAATPTRTPTTAAVLADAAQTRSRVVAPSVTSRTSSPTRRPPSPTATNRSAQQAPPTTTATPTRTVAPAQPTVTPTTTRPPATETPRPSATSAPATATSTPAPPTATRTAGATSSPTARPAATATPTVAELPSLARTQQAVRGWQEGALLVLDVPIRSQLDGSDYQGANCGPASLAMVLEAFDVEARTPLLRNYANLLQGTYGRDDGIALSHLADIAREAGLRPLGLRDAWSVEAVRAELRRGHPVITLVKMRLLPDHAGSRSETDHYVVVVGLDGDELLINDPALPGERGFRRRLTAPQLEAAWAASSVPRQGLAIGAADGIRELSFGEPAVTAAPAIPATPTVATAPAQPQPIVIVITPAPPPVIVLNVPAMPQAQTTTLTFPTPLPDRWSRPGRLHPGEATPVPLALPPREEAVVLGEALPPVSDSATRWLLRLTLVAAAGNLLRRLLR